MIIKCAQCGQMNSQDNEFCDNCGAQLPAAVGVGGSSSLPVSSGLPPAPVASVAPPTAASNLICPNPACKAPLAPGDEFCFNCGTDVRNLTSVPASGAGSTTPPPPSAIPAAGPGPAVGQSGAADAEAQRKADEELERALAELGGPGPADVTLPAVNMAGPEAQPAVVPPQAPPNPPVGSSGAGSVTVPPGPSGGVAANAFGAPPASMPIAGPATTGPAGALRLHIAGPYGDEVVEWKGLEILLGRRDAKTRVFPQVNLDDSAASRRHLSIWKEDADAQYYVQDLESANGTVLNGQDLRPGEPALLNNGDVIKIGTRYSIQVKIS